MATTEEERQAEVDAACEAILARGERPTVDRVRDHLGGGSPNRLTPLVRAWKARWRAGARTPPPPSLDTEQRPAETPVVAQPAVDALSNAVEALRSALDGLPRAFVQVASVAAETERRRSDLEVQSIKAATDAQVREAAAETADERGLVDLLREEVDAKEAEAVDLAARLGHARAEALRFQTALGDEESKAAELRTALGRATARVAELDALLDATRREASAAAQAVETARAEGRDAHERRDALQAQLMERSAELAEARTGIAVAQQAARSAEAAARAGEEARGVAVQQARADAERAGAAEARARAVEDQAKKLEADLERLRNATPPTLAAGASPASGNVVVRQERTGKRGGAGVEASA